MSDTTYRSPLSTPIAPPPPAYDANGDPVPVPDPNARPLWMKDAPSGVAPPNYDKFGNPIPVPDPNARPPWMAGAPEGVAPPPPTYDKFGNPIPPGTEVQPPALAPIGRPVVGTGDISERMAHLEAHVREIWQLLRSSPAIAPPVPVTDASSDTTYVSPLA